MTATVLPQVLAETGLLVMDDGECTNNSIESTTANKSFDTGPIPQKQTKWVQEKGNNMTALLHTVESSNKFIMSASNKQEQDAN